MNPTFHILTGAYLLVAQASVLLAAALYVYRRDFGPLARASVATRPQQTKQRYAHV